MSERTRTCPECGATTGEGAQFCRVCGSPLQEVTTAKRRATAAGPRHAAHARPSKKSGRGRLVLAALAGGLAALTLVMCALVYMGVLKSPSIPSGTLTPINIEHGAQDYNGISSEIDRLGAVDAELVSLDATDFPTMRAYVRVADAGAADVLSSSRIALLEGVTDGEMLEYPLPDGSSAHEYGGADGFTESLYKTADGGIIDCRSYYLKDPSFYKDIVSSDEMETLEDEYAKMQDLMSIGGEADANDCRSYPSHLWASATRI